MKITVYNSRAQVHMHPQSATLRVLWQGKVDSVLEVEIAVRTCMTLAKTHHAARYHLALLHQFITDYRRP